MKPGFIAYVKSISLKMPYLLILPRIRVEMFGNG